MLVLNRQTGQGMQLFSSETGIRIGRIRVGGFRKNGISIGLELDQKVLVFRDELVSICDHGRLEEACPMCKQEKGGSD